MRTLKSTLTVVLGATVLPALAMLAVVASCGRSTVETPGSGIDASQAMEAGACNGFPTDCHWPGECDCECGWTQACVAGQWTCGETPARCVKLCAPITCPCATMAPGCDASAD